MKGDNLPLVEAAPCVIARDSRFNYNFLCLLFLLTTVLPLRIGAQEIPVKEMINSGERTEYDMYFKWGILMPHAGQASLSISNSKFEGNPSVHYRLLFRTHGLFERIFTMRDTIDCQFSPDMRLLFSQKRVNENDYYLIDDLDFSYKEGKSHVHSRRYTRTKTKIDTMLVADGLMFDMLGATLYLRSLDWAKMQIGDEFPFKVALGRDVVNISFRYSGQQIVERTERLKYRTQHFFIDITDEAFTQTKAAAEIWVGDDPNHLPIRIRAKLKIGYAEVHYKSSSGLRHPLTSRVVIPRQ